MPGHASQGNVGLIMGILGIAAYIATPAKPETNEHKVAAVTDAVVATALADMGTKGFFQARDTDLERTFVFKAAFQRMAADGKDVGAEIRNLTENGGCVNKDTPSEACFIPSGKLK